MMDVGVCGISGLESTDVDARNGKSELAWKLADARLVALSRAGPARVLEVFPA